MVTEGAVDIAVWRHMDTGALVVELVKAGAWPAASIALAIMFRTPLTNLVQGLRLTRLKRGDWEAEFHEALAETERDVAALPPVPPEASARPKLIDDRDVGTSPAAVGAVVTAWNQVERMIDDAARETGVSASAFLDKIRGLAEKGVLESSTVDAVNGLRMLRNLAVHSPDPFEPDNARHFLQMANAVLFALSMNVKKYVTADARQRPDRTP